MPKATIKSSYEIALIRESCHIVAEVLRLLTGYVRAGITTKELDTIAEEFIRSRDAEPAFKGYGTDRRNLYPASICTSVNDEVVHGIPGSRTLQDGDIVSVDVGVKKQEFYGDGAWTFQIGSVSDEKIRLMRVTEESLYKGIEQARAGNRVHDISSAVQRCVEGAGYSVVRDLVGHGVGRYLHEEPAVPNFGKAGTGMLLQSGMTIAIEPMVNAGEYDVKVDNDGWTVRTLDGSSSAHFEHTILITDHEPEILTT